MSHPTRRPPITRSPELWLPSAAKAQASAHAAFDDLLDLVSGEAGDCFVTR